MNRYTNTMQIKDILRVVTLVTLVLILIYLVCLKILALHYNSKEEREKCRLENYLCKIFKETFDVILINSKCLTGNLSIELLMIGFWNYRENYIKAGQ